MIQILEKLNKVVGGTVTENEILAPHTTFKIGGPARYFFVANSNNEIIQLVSIAAQNQLPYFILGGGSNLLISDNGFNGLVIKNNSQQIEIKDNIIKCDSGVTLSQVIKEATDNGLSGLEWAVGIPGTIGGAVRGNAGAYGSDIATVIKNVEVLRVDKKEILENEDCQFNYRDSIFKQKNNQDIILSITLALEKKDTAKIKETIANILKERSGKFDKGFCAGCIFKNIEISQEQAKKFQKKFSDFPKSFIEYGKIPAGWLIDQCGLKGKEVGNARVSDKHAAIIMNIGQAKAQNVVDLIDIIKQEVKNKFNLVLEEEIVRVGL